MKMHTNYSQVDSFFIKDNMQVKCSSEKFLQTKFKLPTPRPARIRRRVIYITYSSIKIWIKKKDPLLCELAISSYIP